MVSQEYD